jgi:hypothetical protein
MATQNPITKRWTLERSDVEAFALRFGAKLGEKQSNRA